MKNKWGVRLLMAALVALLVGSFPAAAYDAYVYSYEGESKESPPMYEPVSRFSLADTLPQAEDGQPPAPSDLFAGQDGRLYIPDSANNRILIYGPDGTLQDDFSAFTNPGTGQPDSFSKPQGVFVDDGGQLYVADTGNARILVFDADRQAVSIIGAPAGNGVPKDFVYMPTAVVADKGGRIYVVSKSVTMGIVSFTMDGTFEGFLGAQVVTPTAWDLFWRTFMTEAQLSWMKKLIPTEYNNIAIDDTGFLYVTSSSIDMNLQYNATTTRSKDSDYAPIRRLNPSGEDVLNRNGFFPPSGDVEINRKLDMSKAVSALTDVAIGPYNTYTVLDQNNQHVFTYDTDGNLLCAYGGNGQTLGTFQSLTAVCYEGDSLWILDGQAGVVTHFTPTAYGSNIMKAIALKNDRQYDASLQKWQEILTQNRNMDVANIHIGRVYLSTGEYEKAMDCFRLVNDQENYSKAFQKHRDAFLNRYFLLIPILLIAAIYLVLLAFKKLKAYNTAGNYDAAPKRSLGSQMAYSAYTLFHPFDGFYEVKMRSRGGTLSATIILILAVLAIFLRRVGSGYLLSSQSIYEKVDGFGIVLSVLAPFFLFCIANWCVGSFQNGEANFHHIYVTTAYALLPLVIILIPLSLLSNGLTLQEEQLVILMETLAYVWTGILLFFGIMTVQAYSFGKNIASFLLTLVAIAIITFIILLGIALLQRIVGFITEVCGELLYRF